MGKYLDYANQCLQRLKPQVEEKTGVKLEDIVVKDSSACKEFDTNYCDADTTMFVDSYYPSTIFLVEKTYDKKEDPCTSIPIGIVHELSHFVHDISLEKEVQTIKSESRERRFFRRGYRESFREGFACYMSLDYLIDLYNHPTRKKAIQDREFWGSYGDFSPEEVPYERGYKFFKKVLYAIGEDKVFEVARAPPISEMEARMPLLYLLRKYPFTGIRKQDEFTKRCINTKIIKIIYGYAPFDFPRPTEKYSGWGKVFKSLQDAWKLAWELSHQNRTQVKNNHFNVCERDLKAIFKNKNYEKPRKSNSKRKYQS